MRKTAAAIAATSVPLASSTETAANCAEPANAVADIAIAATAPIPAVREHAEEERARGKRQAARMPRAPGALIRDPPAERTSSGMRESRAMKVAISGASGLIGQALVPALRERGHEVVRLVRRQPEAVDEVPWDPPAGVLDPHLVAGVDAFVNLSGATIGARWTEARKREIRDSRVHATALLARTVAALDGKPALVSAGGIGIYGDRGDEILTEESELGSGFLAEVGRAWEASAEPAREVGARVVTLRQGIVLSRRGGALAKMLTPFRLGLGGRVGSGRQWWSWVALDDVVAAYAFALEGELEGPYNLVSPNPATSAQLTRALGRVLGRPTIFPLPALAVRTLFGEMGEATLLQGQRALPARLLDAGFTFSYPELEAALRRALEA